MVKLENKLFRDGIIHLIKYMKKFDFKTISYHLARKNYSSKSRSERTKWDTLDGKRLLNAFTLASKGGFMREFLDDLLSEKEYKRFTGRLKVLELLFMGAPYSFISKSIGQSSKYIADISKKTANKENGYYKAMRDQYPRGFKYFE